MHLREQADAGARRGTAAGRSPGAPPRLSALSRPRYPGASVPPAVVTCLAQARKPTQQEIESVAGRIWADVQGRAQQERSVFGPRSPAYRRMIVLARAALGLTPVPPDGRGLPPQSR